MRKSKFATGSGRPRRAILGLDSLEGRVMPDGKIIASLSPTGVLTITGDDAPNGLTITVTATDVTIDPDASTFLNSKALGDSETFLGVVKTIKADFKGGNDSISISPTLPFVVPGAVSFLLGDGDNTLDLTTDKVITLGSLFTKGGDGLDTVTVQAGIG